MLAPARLLATILARTAALLGLLGGPPWLAALGTTAAAFGCALVAFGCALVAFGCALFAFGCALLALLALLALVAFGCALFAFGCGFGDYMPFRFTKFFFCFCYNFVVAYVFDCH